MARKGVLPGASRGQAEPAPEEGGAWATQCALPKPVMLEMLPSTNAVQQCKARDAETGRECSPKSQASRRLWWEGNAARR